VRINGTVHRDRPILRHSDFVNDGINHGVFERARKEYFAKDPRVFEAPPFLVISWALGFAFIARVDSSRIEERVEVFKHFG